MKILLIIQIISYLINPESAFHRSYVNMIIPLINIIQLCFPEINNQIQMRLISPEENLNIRENRENNTSYNNQSGGNSANGRFNGDAQGDISKKYFKK